MNIFILDKPIEVGDLDHSVTVSALKLISISMNFEDIHTRKGVACLSICLGDTVTPFTKNVVYHDAAALAMAGTIEQQIGSELFAKLIADGKLPQGTLTTA